MLDDHHRGVRHVDPHLDDRRCHQHLDLPLPELVHHLVLLLLLHPPVEQSYSAALERTLGQLLPHLDCRSQLQLLRLLDQGVDHVGLLALTKSLPDKLVDLLAALLRHPVGLDPALLGQLIEDGDLEMAIQRQGDRPRDGGSTHHQDVQIFALPLQMGSLNHPKAVLLVDHRQAEALKAHLILDQGVGSDYQVWLAFLDHAPQLGLLPLREASDEQTCF